MKIISKNLKYIIFALVLIVSGFAFSHQAFAITYSGSACQGGNITATTNLSSTSSASLSSTLYKSGTTGEIFTAYSTITNNGCPSIHVKLSMTNSYDGTEYLVQGDTPLGPGGNAYPVHNFPIPSPAGAYNVTFKLSVLEPSSLILLAFPSFTSGWTNGGFPRWEAGATLSSPSIVGSWVTLYAKKYVDGSFLTADETIVYIPIGAIFGEENSSPLLPTNSAFTVSDVCVSDYSADLEVGPTYKCAWTP